MQVEQALALAAAAVAIASQFLALCSRRQLFRERAHEDLIRQRPIDAAAKLGRAHVKARRSARRRREPVAEVAPKQLLGFRRTKTVVG